MKTSSVLKRLAKHGVEVKIGDPNKQYSAVANGQLLTWWDQEGDTQCFHIKGVHEQDDLMTDYFPGCFPKTLRWAMKLMKLEA